MLPASKSPHLSGAQISGNHRLAIVRVQFQEDATDLTTGDGLINLSDTTAFADSLIDIPPHNASYFRDQVVALNSYYSRVSRNNLTIDTINSDIFPAGETAAYTLPGKMQEYGRGFVDSTQQNNWADLLYDTYQTANIDVDFSQYSTVVIFHAGVGQDFDIPLDDSPFDIQSAYLDPEFIQTNFSDSIQTVLENAGLQHVIVLPETQSQLGVSIGLTGTFALLFGSRFGLPALYNTSNGTSVVGKFGLLDIGSNNANGIAPAYPTAWTRIYAGWDSAATIHRSGQYQVQSPETRGNKPTILKIPLSNAEYYLVENRLRQTRASSNDSFIVNFDTLFVQRNPQTHVITSVEEYDAGLPGDGLLIWHIDEKAINTGLADNAINADASRLGVDIEEADGAQDIGQSYGPFSGGVENGWFYDFWFAGNEGFFHLNPDFETDADSTIGFTPFTHPSTMTNDGYYSGVELLNIPKADSVITLRVNFRRTIDGYPYTVTGQVTEHFFTLAQDGIRYIVNGIVGTTGPDSVLIGRVSGSNYSEKRISVVNSNKNFALKSLTSRMNNQQDLILGCLASVSGSQNDSTTLSQITFSTNTGSVQNKSLVSTGGKTSSQLVDDSTAYLFATNQDTIYRVFPNGTIDWQISVNDSIQSLSVSDNQEINLGTTGGLLQIDGAQTITQVDTGNYLSVVTSGNTIFGKKPYALTRVLNGVSNEYLPADSRDGVYEKILTANPDNDGANELIALEKKTNATWQIAALNSNSSIVNNFPIPLRGTYQNKNIALGDLNNDALPEIIAVSDSGHIYAYTSSGELLWNYPIDVGERVDSPVMLSHEDERMGVFVRGQSGKIYGYYTQSTMDVLGGKIIWSGSYGNLANTNTVPAADVEGDNNTDDAIHRAYVYPNPVKSDHATLRIEINDGEEIAVAIYDFSGRFIQEWSLPVTSSERVYEIPWDTSSLPSGVYFGKVNVSGGGVDEIQVVKIALIR